MQNYVDPIVNINFRRPAEELRIEARKQSLIAEAIGQHEEYTGERLSYINTPEDVREDDLTSIHREAVFREKDCLRFALEAEAFADALEGNKKAVAAYREMMDHVSPSKTLAFSDHDNHMFAAAPGFRILESGVPVWPVYMGSQTPKLIFGDSEPIYQRAEYQNINGNRGPSYGLFTGRKVYRGHLPQLIAEWGAQFKS